jgi:hypothetical protein
MVMFTPIFNSSRTTRSGLEQLRIPRESEVSDAETAREARASNCLALAVSLVAEQPVLSCTRAIRSGPLRGRAPGAQIGNIAGCRCG